MKTIDLKYPIERAGEKVASLSMRRPKVLDMIAAEKSGGNDGEKEVVMFSNLCEVSPDCIMDMDGADYLKLQKVYSGFLS